MRRLIGYKHVSVGGEIGSPHAWAAPYLDDEHTEYATRVLFAADALLLGRRTYEGLSAAYPAMADDPRASNEFIDRMNSIPKFVASRTTGPCPEPFGRPTPAKLPADDMYKA